MAIGQIPVVNPIKIFISYCQEDVEFATIVNEVVIAGGFTTYFAPHSNNTGDAWLQNIEKEIKNCQAMILLWSSHSSQSKWVKDELEKFELMMKEADTKKLFPILLSGGEEEFPLALKIHQRCDCRQTPYADDNFRKIILNVLFSSLQKNFPQISHSNDTAVIVYAMTSTHLAELVSEVAFDSDNATKKDKKHYEEFRAILEKHQIHFDVLKKSYGNSALDWKPWNNDQSKTIQEIVIDIKNNHNEKCQQANNEHIGMRFFDGVVGYDIKYGTPFANNMLFIDAISLFHPDLRTRLVNSGIMGSEPNGTKLMINIVPPISHNHIPMYKFFEEMYYKKWGFKERAFTLFSNEFEPSRELGIGDQYSLSRWIASRLKQVAETGTRIDPNKRKIVNEKFSPNASMYRQNLAGAK